MAAERTKRCEECGTVYTTEAAASRFCPACMQALLERTRDVGEVGQEWSSDGQVDILFRWAKRISVLYAAALVFSALITQLKSWTALCYFFSLFFFGGAAIGCFIATRLRLYEIGADDSVRVDPFTRVWGLPASQTGAHREELGPIVEIMYACALVTIILVATGTKTIEEYVLPLFR